jgi:hypothetical protein
MPARACHWATSLYSFFVHLILIRRLKQAHQPAFPELYFDKCPANALKIEDWSNGKTN